MITNENKKLAQWAMEFALKNGCQASRVSIYNCLLYTSDAADD